MNYDIPNGVFYVEGHGPWLKDLCSLSSVVGILWVFRFVTAALAGVLLMLVPWFATKGDGVALSAPLMAVVVSHVLLVVATCWMESLAASVNGLATTIVYLLLAYLVVDCANGNMLLLLVIGAFMGSMIVSGVINGVTLGETIEIGRILYWLGIPIGTFSALVSLYDENEWLALAEIMN